MSVKGQITNILGVSGCTVFFTAAQFCPYSGKAAIDNI